MRQLKHSEIAAYRAYLLRKQKGRCLICKKKTDRPCLDHHHKRKVKGTGQIRGVLCSNCNVFLAKIENNATRYAISQKDLPKILRSVAHYLEMPQLPYIHPSEAPKPKILKKSSFNKLIKEMKRNDYSKKFPEYRVVKNKNKQKLTKPLERLFIQFDIEPEFYGDNK